MINWPEVFISAPIGTLFGTLISFIVWFKWKKPQEEKKDAEAKQNRDELSNKLDQAHKHLATAAQDSAKLQESLAQANKQLATTEEEFQKNHGFVPIDAGLKPFEDRICTRVKSAKKSVKLCLSTPLLYSLKAKKWLPYNREKLNEPHTDYWPKEFCEPFRETLTEHVRQGNLLNVELIHLDDRSTQKLITELNSKVPYEEHKASLDFFIDEVLQKDEMANRKLCNLEKHRVMRVPFYLALFDTDELSGCCGIVAFANDNYLLNESKIAKQTAKDMADTLQAYEFTNPHVVKFLNQLFEQTKLLSDQHLVDFLNICISSGFSWSAIADGVLPGTETKLKPHATMYHFKETS